jgi:hypothetical protein
VEAAAPFVQRVLLLAVARMVASIVWRLAEEVCVVEREERAPCAGSKTTA